MEDLEQFNTEIERCKQTHPIATVAVLDTGHIDVICSSREPLTRRQVANWLAAFQWRVANGYAAGRCYLHVALVTQRGVMAIWHAKEAGD